jgi:hypothetical protein
MVAVSILLDSRGRGEEEERWKKKKTSRGFGRALKYKEQSRAETLWVERVSEREVGSDRTAVRIWMERCLWQRQLGWRRGGGAHPHVQSSRARDQHS